MKIRALRLFNVKRFAGRGVAIEDFSDGVNVLCAANEHGKSTSFEALHALFFQPHTGTPGDVQRLRPYSGGNPLIEADIVTADGHFRLTKQYYSGRRASVTDLATGRLVAQADEAERFIAGLIRGGNSGPAGLLWVRQGITGIEKRSKSEEDGDKLVRASLLESVQGEVEAVTGGRRMAEVLAACAEELAPLVTSTGRPKTGGRYAAAIAEHERLVAEEQRLKADVIKLREALDRRAAQMKRLAEIEQSDSRDERRNAVLRAQAVFDKAKSQSDVLKTAEAQLGLVRQQRDIIGRDLAAFREALGEAERIRTERVDVDARRRTAAEQRDAAIAAIEKATLESDAAERAEKTAREHLARIEAASRAREAAERLHELEQRLADAEATRADLERGEADLALLDLPKGAVDELQKIEIDIARFRAVEDAARPSVAIRYEADAGERVSLDGQPLADGEERGYEGQAQLSVPGIGLITLRSNRPQSVNTKLAAAEASRGKLLASMGVASLAEARQRQVDAQRKREQIEGLRNRIRALAPDGLPLLREEIMRRREAGLAAVDAEGDPEQAKAALTAAEHRREVARDALRQVQPLRGSAEEALIAARTAAAGLDAHAIHVDAVLGLEEARKEREDALAKGLADLETRLSEMEQGVTALRASLIDLPSAEAGLQRARSVEETATREAGALRETIAGLNGLIVRNQDEAIEEQWRETAEAREAAARRVEAFRAEVAALQRLQAALETARSGARDLYLKPVMTELRPLLGLLFNDVSITFDEKTLLPQTILRNGQEEDVERLSGGMREQLSVLTRLSFARLLARDGRPAPVILDDALVYSDDDRIESMFDALHRQSRDQQIIVFSCRQRAFLKLGGTSLRMTDWVPA
ncbi:AAA family ATPase [Terrihabitans rhizophilus]|uniref:AAA family ATPase n=1 Tax=Terrihabitans rhizophilus TaxID=3092662 RepID=A0ABU4RM18_9HYPH|nr:AAA family ATPase [Terrihabitans sp. PJ23]MDX6805859.1 AAA family ATPase [Terrihabitans sp. PJ23]